MILNATSSLKNLTQKHKVQNELQTRFYTYKINDLGSKDKLCVTLYDIALKY